MASTCRPNSVPMMPSCSRSGAHRSSHTTQSVSSSRWSEISSTGKFSFTSDPSRYSRVRMPLSPRPPPAATTPSPKAVDTPMSTWARPRWTCPGGAGRSVFATFVVLAVLAGAEPDRSRF